MQLALELGFELGVGRGRTDRDQITHALHFVQLADFLGRIQFLLIEINRAGKRHNAVFRGRLQVAELLLFGQLLGHAVLDIAVIAGAVGLGRQANAEYTYRKK